MGRLVDKTRGTIDRLDAGYGFIEGDDGTRYFFYYKALDTFGPQFRDLERGMRVAFTPLADARRPSAIEVQVLQDEAVRG